MHIIELRATNLGILKAVRIVTEGKNAVVITGANANGKSTVLDAIVYALSGGKSFEKIRKPIRDGQERAEIVLKTDKYTVTRWWTSNDKSYLKVETAEGFEVKSPQALLDELLGDLTFDPIAFTAKKPAEQRQMLLDMFNVDTAEIDREYKKMYDERTDVNSQYKALAGTVTTLSAKFPDDIATWNVEKLANEHADLLSQYDEISIKEQDVKALQVNLDISGNNLKMYEEQIEELESQLKNLISKRDETFEKVVQIKRDLDEAIEKVNGVDTQELDAKLLEYERKFTLIDEYRRLEDVREQADQLSTRSKALTELIEANRAAKQKMVDSIELPIEGLRITDEGIDFLDTPLEQCSTAQKIMIGASIGIAQNPKLRIMLIREGSNLDSHSLAVLEEIAAENDFQVFVEKVDESGKIGIVMQDGEVVAEN